MLYRWQPIDPLSSWLGPSQGVLLVGVGPDAFNGQHLSSEVRLAVESESGLGRCCRKRAWEAWRTV